MREPRREPGLHPWMAAFGHAAGAVLFALLTIHGAAGPLHAATRIRVGLYENSPKVAISPSGRGEGIFVDLMDAIAKREGWTVTYVPGTWSEGLDRLAAGTIDIMPDVAFTPERERDFVFHREPVLSSWNQVYARRGSGIRSLPDLEGRRVAVVDGSIQQDLFGQMVASFGFGVRLVPKPDFDAAFAAVVNNEADAVVTNRFYGATHSVGSGLEDTAIIFAPSRLHFAARKGLDPAILAAIDRNLVAWKADSGSVYFRSLHKWTGDSVSEPLPAWLPAAIAAGILLLIAAAAWLILLRRQVGTRTAIIREGNAKLAIINRTLRATGSSLDLQTVLEATTRGALALTHFDYGMLCVRNADGSGMRLGAIVAGEAGGAAAADGPLRNALCPPLEAALALGSKPLVLPAYAAGRAPLRVDVDDPQLQWTAFFPFEARGHFVALLCLFSRNATPPAKRDTALVQELGVPVALAMENARLYEEAKHHAEELERRVEERTSELADAKLAAEAADRIKSAFLATMSHELRTPLNSIIGFTGIVSQGLAGPLNDEQKRQLGMVRDSAQHLLALINDVLDISKIEAGELVVADEPFDLAASIAKVARIITPLAERKALRVSVEVDPRVGTIVGDSRRVEQILLNLLSNAIKFTEQGSVALDVGLVDGWTNSDGFPPSAAVRIRVSDTGIGIKPDEIAQLFRPFRQIDSTLSRKHEGTGLGLAICRRLTELMGGVIDAESRWGEGSVFTVHLPARAPEAVGVP